VDDSLSSWMAFSGVTGGDGDGFDGGEAERTPSRDKVVTEDEASLGADLTNE
jgi:hypothetical protein